MDLARALAGPLRAAWDALERGEISYRHAKILADETMTLDEAAARVAEAALPGGRAGRQRSFAGAVRRAVIAADPVRAELAAQRAAAGRMVARRALPDAQAALFVTGPAVDVQTIWTALDAFAARRDGGADPAGSADGDGRTLDQRRFDALVRLCRDALAGPDRPRGRPGVPPTVYLFADLPTWLGLADNPVELDGYGVVPAGVARARLADARWRALVTDAVTATVRAVGDRGYRPSAATTRLLHVRDRRCGFPGCAAAVWFCDADHNRPHDAGGCTDANNCGLFCRRHHRLKTFTAWTWRRAADGSIERTDPHGHTWCRDPIRHHTPDPDGDEDEPPAGRVPEPTRSVAPVRPPADDLGDPPILSQEVATSSQLDGLGCPSPPRPW